MLEMNKLVSFASTDIVLTNHKNKMKDFIYYTPSLSLISRNVELYGFVVGVCYASPPLNVVRVLCQNKAYDFIVAENNCKPYNENISSDGIRINENIKNSFNKIATVGYILTQYEADIVFELLLKEYYRAEFKLLVDDVIDSEIWYRIPFNGEEYSLHQDLFTYCNEYVNYVQYRGWTMTGYYFVKYENKNKQQLIVPCLVNDAVFEKFEDFVPILYKKMYDSSIGE
jgi:hypothetical protein